MCTIGTVSLRERRRKRREIAGLPAQEPGPADLSRGELALAELGRLARLVQSGLLALDLTRIAREEALALERHPQLGIGLDECACDSVTNSAGLTGQPAPVDADAEIVLALDSRDLQRRRRDRAPDVAGEVLVEGAAVDPRRPVAGAEDDACNGRLALAGAAILGDLTHVTAPNSMVE